MPGWEADEHDDWNLNLWAPNDGPAYFSVNISVSDDAVSVEEVCARLMTGFLAGINAMSSYELISVHYDDYGKQDCYGVNYRYRGEKDSEASIKMMWFFRSRNFVYVLEADALEKYFREYSVAFNQMLASFDYETS